MKCYRQTCAAQTNGHCIVTSWAPCRSQLLSVDIPSHHPRHHELPGPVPVLLLAEAQPGDAVLGEHNDVCADMTGLLHVAQVLVNIVGQNLLGRLKTVTFSWSIFHYCTNIRIPFEF